MSVSYIWYASYTKSMLAIYRSDQYVAAAKYDYI